MERCRQASGPVVIRCTACRCRQSLAKTFPMIDHNLRHSFDELIGHIIAGHNRCHHRKRTDIFLQFLIRVLRDQSSGECGIISHEFAEVWTGRVYKVNVALFQGTCDCAIRMPDNKKHSIKMVSAKLVECDQKRMLCELGEIGFDETKSTETPLHCGAPAGAGC